MLVSTKGRYALRVMIDLAEHCDEGRVPLKGIAVRQSISEKYLESILKLLVQGGMVVGQRGKGGGYRLAMEPEECTVGAVVRLTEDTTAPVACLESGSDNCPMHTSCRTVAMWSGLDSRINEYLDGITIADLAISENPGKSCPI